jgi:ATPase subunit of ABC transporter with duplicated ATPase domains
MTVDEFLADHGRWSLLRDRLLSQIDGRAPCTTLSGGQWTRVRFARVLDEEFLILDEPTNDLDREGREAVLQSLRVHTGGALLISHDRECLNLCDEVLELSKQQSRPR